MAFEQLTKQEQNIVRQCMEAILNGDEIEAPEFQTRLGIARLQLRQVLAFWPHLDDADDNSDTCLAINNCMNEVAHGIYISPEDWARRFTFPKEDVKAAYKHWAESKGCYSIGIR